MSQWTIYHNPRCSKSRQTLELLKNKNIEPEIIEYLKTPPDEAKLNELLKKLGISAADLLRKKEPVFKELKIDLNNENAVIKAMVENPVLIERPIVVKGNKAVLGRPPENIVNLL